MLFANTNTTVSIYLHDVILGSFKCEPFTSFNTGIVFSLGNDNR